MGMPRSLSLACRCLAAASVCLVFGLGGAYQARADKPFTGPNQLIVYFADKTVGSVVFEFEEDGDALIVASRLMIEEKDGEKVLYSRREERREVWRAGKFESFTNKVQEGERSYNVSGVAIGGRLAVSGPNGTVFAPKDAIPTTYWHIPDNRHAGIVNVLTGAVGSGDVVELPPVPVRVNGEEIQARHFLMTGFLNRSLYYGPENRWLGMRHLGADGRMVEFRPE